MRKLNIRHSMQDSVQVYSNDYFEARSRFRQAAERQATNTFALVLEAPSPRDEPLTIDIAWLGSQAPKKALVHVSGVHGVEGFVGSAIQLALLRQPPKLPKDTALILVHSLNPYGMAHLRRVNENNVDLNRNFLTHDEEYSGVAEDYLRLHHFLNPKRMSPFDSFFLRSAWQVLKVGGPSLVHSLGEETVRLDNVMEKLFRPLKRAVTVGQYEYPEGIFFGGYRREKSGKLYIDWMRKHLRQLEYLFVIDVHSGLGKPAQNSLFYHHTNHDNFNELKNFLTVNIFQDQDSATIGYPIRGGHYQAYQIALRSVPYNFLTQEFGTSHPFMVLNALRDENYYHHSPAHPFFIVRAKQRLKELFYPQNPIWKRKVMHAGLDLVWQVLEYLAQKPVSLLDYSAHLESNQ